MWIEKLAKWLLTFTNTLITSKNDNSICETKHHEYLLIVNQEKITV